jgi:hypothetical protein
MSPVTVAQYKGFEGEVVEDGDSPFVKIVNTRDFVAANFRPGDNVQAVFEELVDDYLETRAAIGD